MGARERRTGIVTVAGGGLTVAKELLAEEYTRPAIRFVVENEADEGRTVCIVDHVPEPWSTAVVGFHPDRGAEHWTCYDDGRVEFERDVPPGTEYETVYGLDVPADELQEFCREPGLRVDGETVVVADGGNEGGEPSATTIDTPLEEWGGDNDEDDTGSDRPTDGSGGDDTAVVSDDGSNASLDIEIPGEVSLGGEDGDDPQSTTDAEGVLELSSPIEGVDEATGLSGPETGSVVERLVEELKRNEVDAEQRRILREQLDLGISSMTKARLNQLSTRVEKIAAYADALEEFLDEEGTAQEVIRDFELQVGALREDVAELRDQARTNASDVDALDGHVGSLTTRVDELEETLDDVAAHADDVEDSLSTTASRLEAVEGDLRQTECQVATNVEAIDDLDDTATDIWDEIADVEEKVDTVDEEVTDLADGLETVERDVAEIIEWRDQLGETFH